MKKAVLFLSLILAFLFHRETVAWSNVTPIAVSKGGYSLRVVRGLGIEIRCGPLTILRGSRILLRSRDFREVYYDADDSRAEIRTDEDDARAVIVVTEGVEKSVFNYELRLSISPDHEFSYVLDGKLGNVPDAHLQQDFMLRANMFAGTAFEAITGNQKVSGQIPFMPLPAEKRVLSTKGADTLTLRSRIGPVTARAEGLRLYDFRSITWVKNGGILLFLGQFPEANARVHTDLTIQLPPPPTFPETQSIAVDGGALNKKVLYPERRDQKPPEPAFKIKRLIPAPRFVQARNSVLAISRPCTILTHPNIGAPARRALDRLQGSLPVCSAIMPAPKRGIQDELRADRIIIVSSPETAQQLGFAEVQHTIPEQGYVLDIDKHGIIVAGMSERGMLYGVRTLLQLLPDKGHASIPCARIIDSPDFGLRGAHLTLRSGAKPDISFLKNLFANLFAALKMNMVVLDLGWGYQYSTHPEISAPWAMNSSELRELVTTARTCGLEPIPCIQFFKADKHGNWICSRGGHMELAEDPVGTQLCPSHPGTYKLIFDIMDELIPIFQPVRYFHITGDELFTRQTDRVYGACNRCRATGRAPHELFAQKVTKLHNHLAKKGIKTMIWGDMLLDPDGFPENPTACHGTPIEGWKALPLIPKDIVITDWHYQPNTQYPTLKFFHEQGFDTIPTPWYRKTNIYYIALAGREADSIGFLGSTWGALDERGAIWKSQIHEQDSEGQIGAYVLHAEYGWTAGIPALEKLAYSAYDEALRRLRPSRLAPVREFCLFDLTGVLSDRISGEKGICGSYPKGCVPSETSREVRWVKEVPFQLDDACLVLHGQLDIEGKYPTAVNGLRIEQKADALAFLHACLQTEKPGRPVLRYVIHYEDGHQQVVEARFDQDIGWLYAPSTSLALPRVTLATTKSGTELSAFMMRWDNPHPEKMISKIDIQSGSHEPCPILFAITAIVLGDQQDTPPTKGSNGG